MDGLWKDGEDAGETDQHYNMQEKELQERTAGKPSWLSGWRAGVGIPCARGTGSIPVMISYLVWDGGQWRDSISSARVNPALNGYQEKSGDGKQEGCAKAQDG